MEERREAVEIIRRFVKGEIEEEPLLGFARRLEIPSLHQLSETLELRSEDYRRIGFHREDLTRLLRYFLEGRMDREALWGRVRRTSQLFSSSEYHSASVFRPELSEALSILTLLLDPRSSLDPSRLPGHLSPVLHALEHQQPLPFAKTVQRVLLDLKELHFTSLHVLREEGGGGAPRCGRPIWCDLGLLYRKAGEEERDPEEGDLAPIWFIPLAVITSRFYHEDLPERLGDLDDPGEDWMLAESSLTDRILERHPWVEVERPAPLYLLDPRGFAEVVLDRPHLTRDDLAHAIRLFSLLNGAAAASLDGRPVELYPPCPRLF